MKTQILDDVTANLPPLEMFAEQTLLSKESADAIGQALSYQTALKRSRTVIVGLHAPPCWVRATCRPLGIAYISRKEINRDLIKVIHA